MPVWLIVGFLLLYLALAVAVIWAVVKSRKELRDAKAQKGPF